MKKVIVTMALLTALLGWGAVELFELSPTPFANSVIAEKPVNGRVGGQIARVVPNNLTTKQHQLLNMAYQVGKENGLKDPEIVQAVLLQETHAGGMDSYRVANPGPNAYFGPMQIKLSAARDVLARWPEMFARYNFHTRTDDEVKANLILNERFNIEVATRYLVILKREYGLSGRELMNAYNRGPGGVKAVDADYHYAVGAERKLATYKQSR
jgi:hypothetical protein